MGQIMVVTGEPSGEMHAVRVIKEMKKMNSDLSFVGMGSDLLRKEEVEILIDPMAVSTIGFMEAFKNLKTHFSHIRLLKKYIKKDRPDVLFLVDYSGFNMMMARVGKRLDIPVVNYFPPTAWVWGEWRAKWMAKYEAKIAATLPMDRRVYEKSGADVKFVGHPLLDIVGINKTAKEIFTELELDSSKKVISLMPGSRKSEIETLLPEMLLAAEKLQVNNPEYQFVLPLATGIDRDLIAKMAADYNIILKIVEEHNYEVMKIADLIITASGTATLEAMIMETPMVVIYKTSWTTYQLGKRLMKTDFIAMPNIIAGKEVVPEFIQNEVSAGNIYKEAEFLLHRDYALKNKKLELAKLRKKLGSKGAVRRTAELVLREGELQ